MNSVREIQRLNKREIEAGVSVEGSWHNDYRDTAYIYIGGLPFNLTEGDIITIFSQFGEPTYLNLSRDKETGKSRGFAFLKYEDQRSTDLAVDNLGGATVMGRVLKVDHTRYKQKEGEEEEEWAKMLKDSESLKKVNDESEEEELRERRPLLKEEIELQQLLQDHDEEDPMKEYLVKEKREEVERVLAATGAKDREHRHKHRHHYRSRRDRSSDRGERDERHRQRHHHRHRRRSRNPGYRDVPNTIKY